MRKFLLSMAALAMAISVSAQYPYKLISPIPGAVEGQTIYLTNFDTGEKIDSAAVKDGAVVFSGDLDDAIVVRLLSPTGDRFGTFILEQGTVAVNQTTRRAVGSMLNDRFNEYMDSVSRIEDSLRANPSPENVESKMQEYASYTEQIMLDNMDSALGYYIFIDYASMLEPADMLAFIEEHPDLKNYHRVQGLMAAAEKVAKTSAGQMFVNFEATYDGKTEKFSDYVGTGKYTLVDFWASWCGPCIQEIKVLKEIYAQYHDKGLQILGVAVWDEPQNTLAAIKRLDIPWHSMLNTQNVATDAYGISGIPCIILFGPDGKIINRGARGEELKRIISELPLE